MKWRVRLLAAVLMVAVVTVPAACRRPPAQSPDALLRTSPARHLVLVTIDTLRADHVGAYGYRAARTPALDSIAREGARFEQAFAPAPITLTSHASLFTGMYPPGHGARHNGLRMTAGTATLAQRLRQEGFATGAFVAAFPLDRRFGLDAGFETYGDRLPRGADGRPSNERPGREVMDEALAWLRAQRQDRRIFLWIHLFEPHAPYGQPGGEGRSPLERYDDEVAAADREVARLTDALASRAAETLLIVASDHGEAFGEHGEIGHSIFVYDTTLRVPLLLRGPGIGPGLGVPDLVCLVDVAPTAIRRLGLPPFDADGIDISPALAGQRLPAREIYAESFAPLLDFGWSSLRALRSGRWKAIAAPRPELYDISSDPGEMRDLGALRPGTAAAPADRPPIVAPSPQGGDQDAAAALDRLLVRISKYGDVELTRAASEPVDAASASRLAALGYLHGAKAGTASRGRIDPKDRRDLAARIAMATSDELQGDALRALLGGIVREDPGNGQMRQRLGYALLEAGRVSEAEPQFRAAIAARVPSADPYLGLAMCESRRNAFTDALGTLHTADLVEPGNAVVHANIGLIEARRGRGEAAEAALQHALALDADLHEARFNLALLHARAGRREDARREAVELLRRLPASAPQRAEIERLIAAVR